MGKGTACGDGSRRKSTAVCYRGQKGVRPERNTKALGSDPSVLMKLEDMPRPGAPHTAIGTGSVAPRRPPRDLSPGSRSAGWRWAPLVCFVSLSQQVDRRRQRGGQSGVNGRMACC